MGAQKKTLKNILHILHSKIFKDERRIKGALMGGINGGHQDILPQNAPPKISQNREIF